MIDRTIGGKGAYMADDRTYKVVFPRSEVTFLQDYQTLSPSLGLNSWAAFSAAIHEEALLSGQFLLLPDEVNPLVGASLDAGLEVTGLAPSCLFEGACLYTLDISGRGTFQNLAISFRKGMDEISKTRRAEILAARRWTRPRVPVESAIDGGPLDAILSMRGTVVGGAYRAAIGKRGVVNGEMVGREMGVSTWISLGGTNARAIAHGEFVESPEDLQKVLRALRAKNISIESVRNHMVAEHPQFLFVRFLGQGSALDLARALRYVLDVEAGAIALPGEK
jgi:hypothetical protein